MPATAHLEVWLIVLFVYNCFPIAYCVVVVALTSLLEVPVDVGSAYLSAEDCQAGKDDGTALITHGDEDNPRHRRLPGAHDAFRQAHNGS